MAKSLYTVNIPRSLERMIHDFAKEGGVERVITAAINKTALQGRELIADATPKDTGDTARRWQVQLTHSLAVPGVIFNDSEVALYLEHGTQPHVIRAKGKENGGADALFWRGAVHPVVEVHHPGTPAHFMVRGNIAKIRELLVTNIIQGIEEATR